MEKTASEKALIETTEVLAQAFLNYPLSVWAFRDEARRLEDLKNFYRPVLRYGLLYGKVWTTSAPIRGVAIWFNPESVYPSPRGMLRSGFALLPLHLSIASLKRLARLGKHLQKNRAAISGGRPFHFLSTLAVNPSQQSRGLGRALMKPMLQQADKEKMPCLLETHDRANIAYYERFGFCLARETEPLDGLISYFLQRGRF